MRVERPDESAAVNKKVDVRNRTGNSNVRAWTQTSGGVVHTANPLSSQLSCPSHNTPLSTASRRITQHAHTQYGMSDRRGRRVHSNLVGGGFFTLLDNRRVVNGCTWDGACSGILDEGALRTNICNHGVRRGDNRSACAVGRTVVSDAAELRVKESDRIAATVGFLRSFGAQAGETEDGFWVEGPCRLQGARVNAVGDHRIAMASAVAALAAVAAGTRTGVGDHQPGRRCSDPEEVCCSLDDEEKG